MVLLGHTGVDGAFLVRQHHVLQPCVRKLGDLGPVIAWPLFLSAVVIASTIAGVITGEWRNSGRKALTWMWVGVGSWLLQWDYLFHSAFNAAGDLNPQRKRKGRGENKSGCHQLGRQRIRVSARQKKADQIRADKSAKISDAVDHPDRSSVCRRSSVDDGSTQNDGVHPHSMEPVK